MTRPFDDKVSRQEIPTPAFFCAQGKICTKFCLKWQSRGNRPRCRHLKLFTGLLIFRISIELSHVCSFKDFAKSDWFNFRSTGETTTRTKYFSVFFWTDESSSQVTLDNSRRWSKGTEVFPMYLFSFCLISSVYPQFYENFNQGWVSLQRELSPARLPSRSLHCWRFFKRERLTMTIENSYSLIGAIIWVDPFFSFSGIVFFFFSFWIQGRLIQRLSQRESKLAEEQPLGMRFLVFLLLPTIQGWLN